LAVYCWHERRRDYQAAHCRPLRARRRQGAALQRGADQRGDRPLGGVGDRRQDPHTHTLALEVARLDELQETFYQRALGGDLACAALCTKIIERRCVMLGLSTPQTALLQIVDEATPKEIGRVFAEIAAQKKDDEQTTH
jgi:hypothetical protein